MVHIHYMAKVEPSTQKNYLVWLYFIYTSVQATDSQSCPRLSCHEFPIPHIPRKASRSIYKWSVYTSDCTTWYNSINLKSPDLNTKTCIYVRVCTLLCLWVSALWNVRAADGKRYLSVSAVQCSRLPVCVCMAFGNFAHVMNMLGIFVWTIAICRSSSLSVAVADAQI